MSSAFGAGEQPALVARVHVDVPALDREFDYLVPEKLRASVRVGTIVRVPLHGRRVRGWVTAVADDRRTVTVVRPAEAPDGR